MADELVKITIEEATPAASPSRTHALVAMKDGVTVRLTVAQILALIAAGDIETADISAQTLAILQAAAAKATLVDADRLLGLNSENSNSQIYVTLANIITSIFKSARKIANAQFLSGSFALFDTADPTKGLKFDASSIPTGTTKTIKPQNVAMKARLQDQKASGTAGGASVASAWTTRILNTEVLDPDNIVTLASNQFTVAIDCKATIFAPFIGTGRTRVRLYNVTDAAEVAASPSNNLSNASNVNGQVSLVGYCVAGKTYAVQYYCATAQATNGLGDYAGTGATEIYTDVILEGLAA